MTSSTPPCPSLVPLIRFVLPISTFSFLRIFWFEPHWYKSFLSHTLHNKAIAFEPWQELTPTPSTMADMANAGVSKLSSNNNNNYQNKINGHSHSKHVIQTSYRRTVTSQHLMKGSALQSKLSFLGLIPDFAPSHREQTIHFLANGDNHNKNHQNNNQYEYIIEEQAFFRGLPFAEAFQVVTKWHISPLHGDKDKTPDSHSHNDDNTNTIVYKNNNYNSDYNSCSNVPQTQVHVSCGIRWRKHCWAAPIITTQTLTELKTVLHHWAKCANTHLTTNNHYHNNHNHKNSPPLLSTLASFSRPVNGESSQKKEGIWGRKVAQFASHFQRSSHNHNIHDYNYYNHMNRDNNDNNQQKISFRDNAALSARFAEEDVVKQAFCFLAF